MAQADGAAGGPTRLCVQTISGQECHVELDLGTATVADLRAAIAAANGVPSHEQKLTVGTTELAPPTGRLVEICPEIVQPGKAVTMVRHDPGPQLYLFTAMSARALANAIGGGWMASSDLPPFCKDAVEHQDMALAPRAAREIADALRAALGDAVLPGGESDGPGQVVVITSGLSDLEETCLRALAVDVEKLDEAEVRHWRPTVSSWTAEERKAFCYVDNDDLEENDTEGGATDMSRIKAATQIMVEKLARHFEFNFGEGVVVGPILHGGFASDGSIVAVLSHRVWT
jgi:hypothetical protein